MRRTTCPTHGAPRRPLTSLLAAIFSPVLALLITLAVAGVAAPEHAAAQSEPDPDALDLSLDTGETGGEGAEKRKDGADPSLGSLSGLDDEDAAFRSSLLVYSRTYSLFTASPEANGVPGTDAALVVERFRPKLSLGFGTWGSFELAWDVLPIIGLTSTQATGFAVQGQNALRLKDFDTELHNSDTGSWVLRHNLDRLVFRLRQPGWELRVGRQAVGHGSARIMPAADPFGVFGPGAIDTQFRRGIDGVRLTVPIGESHEVEVFAFANGTEAKNGLYMARWASRFTGVLDLSVLAGYSYARPTAALELTGTAFGAAWYTEGSVRFDPDAVDDTLALRATAGLDYKWPVDLTTTVEVHYNGLGGEAPFVDLFTKPSLERNVGEVFFLGTWYGAVAMSYPFHPLVNGAVAYIQSFSDGSGLLTGSVGWDFAEEVSLGAGLIAPIGKRAELDPTLMIATPRSEFGTYPLVFFTDVRLVF